MSNDLETELEGKVTVSPPPPPPNPPLEEEDEENPNKKFGQIQEEKTGTIYYVSGRYGKGAKKGDKVLFTKISSKIGPQPRAKIDKII